MTQKPNWIRWLLTLVLGWQLLGLAAPAYADTIYVVQSGDTLYRIALRYGVSLQAILTANNLTNVSLIYVGQQLVIPDPGTVVTSAPPATPAPVPVAPAASTAKIYTVMPGDILNRIAIKFGVSQQALMAANGLTNANFLMAGQRLVIPTGEVVPLPAPPSAVNATPAPPSSAPAEATPVPSTSNSVRNNIAYVVKAGDTLWGISRRFRLTVDELKSMNGLYNDYVHVGQQLIIPGPNVTPAPPPTIDAWPPAQLPAWIPVISAHAKDIYLRGVEQGRNPNAFSVAGDCNSDYDIYIGPIARHVVELGEYLYLVNDVNRLWSSIDRHSLATHGGYNSLSVMDPQWANPWQCKPGERPLDCELRVNNSSIVFIALGTGDQFTWRDFEKNYRWMLQSVLAQNVLPVLVTKADTLESQDGDAQPNYINGVIRRLGQE
jgi:LysM repeat protein